jgi:sugar phosphate permease
MRLTATLLLFFVGILIMLLGASYLFGMQTLKLSYDSSCKSICGLGLIFSLFFGQAVGNVVVGCIWSVLGFFLCYFAYQTFG